MIVVLAPEYLPGGLFPALARRADLVILADTYQYSRQSYQNRTRVRTPQGWQWLSVPLLGRQHGRPIRETIVDPRAAWSGSHRRSIQYNYSSAPFYDYYIDPLMEIWDQEWRVLGDLTCRSMEWMADMLAPATALRRASSLPGAPDTLEAICRALGREDVLMPEAQSRRDAARVSDPHVATFDLPAYRQNFEGFVPGMSGLDVLFNYGPESGRLLDAGLHIAPMPARSDGRQDAIHPGGDIA
ncbi:MAG: WbqC family protein [Rhodothermales bacterium]